MEPGKAPASPPRISLWPLALLGTLLFAWSSSKGNQRREPVHPQDSTSSKDDDTRSQPALIANVVPSKPNTESADGGKKRTPLWEKLAVLVALGLLIVNIFQMRATQDAANTATSTYKLTFRSRLVISGMSPEGLDHGRLHISFHVPNYGPTPAKNLRFYRFESIDRWDQTKRMPYGPQVTIYPQMLLPNDTNGMGMTGDRITSENEIKGLISHDLVATFSILIVYEDEIGITHHAEYCEQSTWLQSAWNQPCWWLVQND